MRALLWWIRKLAIPESMVLLGLLVTWYGTHIVDQSAASAFWPTTSGTVLASRVTSTTWSESQTGRYSRSSSTRKRETSYGPYVQYEYRAQGSRYVGEGVRIVTQMYGTAAEAQAIVDRYPVGSYVQVFFDPNDPATSVLQAGEDLDSYVVLFAGGAWTVIWGCVFLVAVSVTFLRETKNAKRNKRPPPWRGTGG